MARDRDIKRLRGQLELCKNLIHVDEIRLGNTRVGAIANKILLDLQHSHNQILKHFLHEDPFLGVDHVSIGILNPPVRLQISNIEFPIELEPLEVGPLVGEAFVVAVLFEGLVLELHATQQVTDRSLPLALVVVCTHSNIFYISIPTCFYE